METEIVQHVSGAKSSHFSPFVFNSPFEGAKLTCQRFAYGDGKYAPGETVYENLNWMKALKARDVGFFRDRAGHALDHLVKEMRGIDDDGPGGNLGAVGWWVEVFAYVKKHDPQLYGAIQGKWPLQPKVDSETLSD